MVVVVVEDVVVAAAVVVDVAVASISSSILRFLIASLFPSFAALVHHLRANSFDWATPSPLMYRTPKLYIASTCPCSAAMV